MEYVVKNVTGSRLAVRFLNKITIFAAISEKDLSKEFGITDIETLDKITNQFRGKLMKVSAEEIVVTNESDEKKILDDEKTDDGSEKIFEVKGGSDKIIKNEKKIKKTKKGEEKVILG